MDLFEYGTSEQLKKKAPLADRMRPQTLDQFVGQEHIVGRGRLLRRAIEIDQLSSIILYGPPGSGKTTLARIIANTTRSEFISINAVLAGVKDIRESIDKAQTTLKLYSRKTILFVDEVHRFNKSQQDALLPHVENGTITLIGATTENPFFEVNKALVSRSRIFQLRILDENDLRSVVKMALDDTVRGYGCRKVEIDDIALLHLCRSANGDARSVLNALELAVETTVHNEVGIIHITESIVEESIQQKAVLYDKDGDSHYDIISAFIKSLRGSDPDAALYWLAKMIYAGEDPRFIFRRMVVFASEDIGLADPQALGVVIAASQSFDFIGMPEGRFPLSQACLYLATAPKSNTTLSLFDALKSIENESKGDVPDHLKDSSRDRDALGHGEGYLYPHAFRDHWVAQQYLPSELQGKVFYNPSDQGYEKNIRERVIRNREIQIATIADASRNDTFLWKGGAYGGWEQRTGESRGGYFETLRSLLFEYALISKDSLVLDLNCQSGFLTVEAVRRSSTGGVWSIVRTPSDLSLVKPHLSSYDQFQQPELLLNGKERISETITVHGKGPVTFDRIIGRNYLSILKSEAELGELKGLLANSGEIILAEQLSTESTSLAECIDDPYLKTVVSDAENYIYSKTGADSILQLITRLESITELECSIHKEKMLLTDSFTRKSIQNWFRIEPDRSSLGDVIETLYGAETREKAFQELLRTLTTKKFPWYQCVCFIRMAHKKIIS